MCPLRGDNQVTNERLLGLQGGSGNDLRGVNSSSGDSPQGASNRRNADDEDSLREKNRCGSSHGWRCALSSARDARRGQGEGQEAYSRTREPLALEVWQG